jgi:predicted nucleic acid-binding protein
MKTSVLIDTNIIIDHLNDVEKATAYLESLPVLRVSSLTVFEVLSGCSGERAGQVDYASELFDICDVVELTEADARRAAGFFRDSPVKKRIIDYLIGATAETHALEVATRNPKDFKTVNAFSPYTIRGKKS